MGKGMAWLAIGGGLATVSALVLTPAIGAVRDSVVLRAGPVSLDSLGSIASFTPVTKDRRLAEVYVKAAVGAKAQRFRFTPSSGSVSGSRSITVAVRAPGLDFATSDRAAGQSVAIAPVSYNLGTARGLTRFTSADNVGRRNPEPPIVNVNRSIDGFSLDRRRGFTVAGKLDRELAGTNPQTMANENRYSVDVESSLPVTRNIDVRAGVRYRSESERLGPLTDDRQDSQAIYVGTAFKF